MLHLGHYIKLPIIVKATDSLTCYLSFKIGKTKIKLKKYEFYQIDLIRCKCHITSFIFRCWYRPKMQWKASALAIISKTYSYIYSWSLPKQRMFCPSVFKALFQKKYGLLKLVLLIKPFLTHFKHARMFFNALLVWQL